VATGRVYVIDAQFAKPRAWERIHCFDENSGEHLWTYREEMKITAGFFEEATELHPCSTPLVSNGVLARIVHTFWHEGDFGVGLWAERNGMRFLGS
jgi:hypothetical protein